MSMRAWMWLYAVAGWSALLDVIVWPENFSAVDGIIYLVLGAVLASYGTQGLLDLRQK